MNSLIEPQIADTLAHAVECLRRSDRALTAREILKSIPPPSRVEGSALEERLRGDARVIAWPPRGRSAPSRYWTRRPEEVIDSLLADAGTAMTATELQKIIRRPLAGFSTLERRVM